jgi:hypothetical protein
MMSFNHSNHFDGFEQYCTITFMAKCIVCFYFLLIAGCATFTEKNYQDQFDTTSRAYEKAILLGKYELADSFRKMHASEKQSSNFETLKKIKVTSYELLAVNVSKDKSLVNQKVEIKYYHVNYLIEKTIIDNQLWRYYPEEKVWLLESGLPDFQ